MFRVFPENKIKYPVINSCKRARQASIFIITLRRIEKNALLFYPQQRKRRGMWNDRWTVLTKSRLLNHLIRIRKEQTGGAAGVATYFYTSFAFSYFLFHQNASCSKKFLLRRSNINKNEFDSSTSCANQPLWTEEDQIKIKETAKKLKKKKRGEGEGGG